MTTIRAPSCGPPRAVFRSLKSELGLRQIDHQKQRRTNGHLFITVLAYQLVQVLRRRLREQREHRSWCSPCAKSWPARSGPPPFARADGSTLHARKATLTEPEQRAQYDALGVDRAPGGIKKLVGSIVRLMSVWQRMLCHPPLVRSANSFFHSKLSLTVLNFR